MARLVEVGETDEGGSVYETVLDSEDDINALYKLMIELEKGGARFMTADEDIPYWQK